MASPSELEGVVLGIVHALEPCTSYAIRRELSESPSTYWSASAGSIYPLIARLVRNGWIASTLDESDGRGRRLLSLEPSGKDALRTWTMGGSDPEVTARMYDSLRLRVFSLGALKPAERRRFVRRALGGLEAALDTARSHMESKTDQDDEYDRLASLGGVYEAESRLAWMREVAARIG